MDPTSSPLINPATTPSGKPPLGQTIDFSSPENRATLYIGVSSVLAGISFIFVALKLYTRTFIQNKLGWDDLATVIATIGQNAYTGIVIWNMNRGAARHIWDVPLATFLKEISLSSILAIIQQPTLLATKLALLGLYYRLFERKLGIKYAILAGIVSCFVIYTTMMFLFIFIKVDTRLIIINKALGVLNIATDLYIFVIPLAAVSGLHLSPRKKFGLAAIFMTGALAVAMSIISLVFRFQVTTTTSDISWDFVSKFITLTVEIYVGIMCGCMPVLPALIQKSGASQWWSSTFRSLASRLLGSDSGTRVASTKKSSAHDYNSSGRGDTYVELQENRSNRKLVSADGSERGPSFSEV